MPMFRAFECQVSFGRVRILDMWLIPTLYAIRWLGLKQLLTIHSHDLKLVASVYQIQVHG